MEHQQFQKYLPSLFFCSKTSLGYSSFLTFLCIRFSLNVLSCCIFYVHNLCTCNVSNRVSFWRKLKYFSLIDTTYKDYCDPKQQTTVQEGKWRDWCTHIKLQGKHRYVDYIVSTEVQAFKNVVCSPRLLKKNTKVTLMRMWCQETSTYCVPLTIIKIIIGIQYHCSIDLILTCIKAYMSAELFSEISKPVMFSKRNANHIYVIKVFLAAT